MEILLNGEAYPLNSEAFEEWCKWRKTEKRKPVTERADRMQRKFLQQYPEDIQAKIMSDGMRNDHQGLFEPKNTPAASTGSTRDTSFEHDLANRDWAN